MAATWKVFEGDIDELVGCDVQVLTHLEVAAQGRLVRTHSNYIVVKDAEGKTAIERDEIDVIKTLGMDYSDVQPVPELSPEAIAAPINGSVPPAVLARKKYDPKADQIQPINDPEPTTDTAEVTQWVHQKWEADLELVATGKPSQLHPFLASIGQQVELGRSLSEKQVAAVLKFKANDKLKTEAKFVQPAGGVQVASPSVPEGRYAVEEEGELHFFKLDHGKKGSRWEGFTFLSIMASDDEHPIKNPARKQSILAAIAVDPKAASARYGHEIGKCGVCGATLTDPESRARGIGPICADKF